MSPTEPIFLGGFCIGGILAYEIAQQLKHLNVDVAMLVLLDTPNPKYFNNGDPPRVSIRRAQYVLKRAARIGARVTLLKARERFSKRFQSLTTVIGEAGEVDLVQQEVERAATAYHALPYDGRALLVLAADHSPDLEFEAGWRDLIPGTLDVEYVNHHHTELMKASNVRSVATSISPHLGELVAHGN